MSFEWLIVRGSIHDVHIAARLLGRPRLRLNAFASWIRGRGYLSVGSLAPKEQG